MGNIPHRAHPGGLDHHPIPNAVFDSVSMDFVDLPDDSSGYNCVLVVVDRLSGFIIVEPTKKLGLTSKEAA